MPRPEASSRTGTKGARVLGHGSATFSLTVYGHLFDDDLDALAGRLDELRRAPDMDANVRRPTRGPVAANGHGASRDNA